MTATSPATWHRAPPAPILADDEVHVWRVDLTASTTIALSLRATLSAEELARVSRFRSQQDRVHFIVAHGALRDVLARYLHCDAADIRFRTSDHGQPQLAHEPGFSGESFPDLRFSLSHSGDTALVAVTWGRRVGVDIEDMEREIDQQLIASRSFSPGELAQLHALPDHLSSQAFFNCWTRKESYLKAQGVGLLRSLDTFEVSLQPGEAPQLLAVADEPDAPSQWTLADLCPGPPYAAALACEGQGLRLGCWQWVPPRLAACA